MTDTNFEIPTAYWTIWTHSGVFHADDVFSVAMMKIVMDTTGKNHCDIIRSRTKPDTTIDITIDVGGVYDPDHNLYDHHMIDIPVRDNGIKYAAFGMLCKDKSRILVYSCLKHDIMSYSDDMIDRIVKVIEDFAEVIDAADNGQQDLIGVTKAPTISGIISSFYPVGNSIPKDIEDAAFDEAVIFAMGYLKRMIAKAEYRVLFSKQVMDALIDARHLNNNFLKLHEGGPFLETIMDNYDQFDSIDVVVYPVLAEGNTVWHIRTMPGTGLEGYQCGKCHAPIEWRGKSPEQLEQLTGLDFVFVHPSGFLGAIRSVHQVEEAVRLWTENSYR